MTPAGARLLLGSAWIALLGGLLWLEAAAGTHWGTQTLAALLAGAAAWEFAGFWPPNGPRRRAAVRTLLSVAVVAALAASGGSPRWSDRNLLLWFLLAALAFAAAPGTLRVKTAGGAPARLHRLTGLLAGLLYILQADYLIGIRREQGLATALWLVAACKGGDIAAYYAGRAWGRRPLAPRVSPQKTVEGAAAGLAAAALAGLGGAFAGTDLPPLAGALWGAAAGLAGQAGDLFESLLKRRAGVKDSGGWPGLGGAFDLLDSLLAAAPAGYYLHRALTP